MQKLSGKADNGNGSGTVNVLIVNQQSTPVDVLTKVLESASKYKFIIQYTDSIEQGEQMLNETQDLVISGLGRNWGDGYAFLAYVRERFPEKKTIIMTGYGELERETALSKGADGFLPLPFELPEAVKTIEDVIEN